MTIVLCVYTSSNISYITYSRSYYISLYKVLIDFLSYFESSSYVYDYSRNALLYY